MIVKNVAHYDKGGDRTPNCGCGSAVAVAAVRGETTGILEKSHKVKKFGKCVNMELKKQNFHRRED